ncbi:MAG TPA: hypothetical protein VNC40_09130 [Gaiellaceae bacterium]|nr:hypothetical protein [Gaiellaceae bacterium]
MSSTVSTLGMVVTALLMVLAGLSKKRLEWKPRPTPRGRVRKPPTRPSA